MFMNCISYNLRPTYFFFYLIINLQNIGFYQFTMAKLKVLPIHGTSLPLVICNLTVGLLWWKSFGIVNGTFNRAELPALQNCIN